MEVRKGYQKTVMGEIPDDWQLCEFAEVMDGFTAGQTPYRAIKRYYTGEIPWITSGELNYNIITETKEKITEEAVRNTGLKIIPEGTFLFAITGLEAEGTRGSCAITGIDAATNQSCMALYPKKNKLITPYLYQYYLRYGNELALKYCQGTKQQSFTSKIAKTLPIIVPPTVEEQTEIATALIETDEFIIKLEKLISKKQNIRQGTLQKLLQPKVGWRQVKLGSLIDKISDGGTPPTSNSSYFGGGINWVVIDDINDEIHNTKQTLTEEGLARCSSNLWPRGTIILSTGATIGEVGILKIPAATKQGICGIMVNKNTDSLFLKYWFQKNKQLLLSKAQGSSIKEVRAPTIIQLDIILPNNKTEQSDISDIIFEMDSEISELNAKLRKLRRIKQGMMQQLLTGKIRLV